MHLAIILDGNRRWARAKKIPTAIGHKKGIANFKNLLPAFIEQEVQTVTAYALSTENLQQRSEKELANLFREFERFAADEQIFVKNEICFRTIGRLEKFPASTRKVLRELERKTKDFKKLTINLAVGYGGRDEICRAARQVAKAGKTFSEKNLSAALDTAGQTDPDLLIRTGGKSRTSNFLIWQAAYAELFFTEKMWPEFDAAELEKAICWYRDQKRTFGK